MLTGIQPETAIAPATTFTVTVYVSYIPSPVVPLFNRDGECMSSEVTSLYDYMDETLLGRNQRFNNRDLHDNQELTMAH